MLTYRHAIGVLARFASSLVRANLLMLTWNIKANGRQNPSNTRTRSQPR